MTVASSSTRVDIRPYRAADAEGWLTCRALSFLSTQYYDDVKPTRPFLSDGAVELVAATSGGQIVGILDIEVDGREATIDTVAVLPGWQELGVASQLLEHGVQPLVDRRVLTLDAWTREDVAANRWYQRHSFVEASRYLHLYLGDGDDDAGFTTPDGLSGPVSAFVHGRIEDETDIRSRFSRVYVCRQYVRPLRTR